MPTDSRLLRAVLGPRGMSKKKKKRESSPPFSEKKIAFFQQRLESADQLKAKNKASRRTGTNPLRSRPFQSCWTNFQLAGLKILPKTAWVVDDEQQLSNALKERAF